MDVCSKNNKTGGTCGAGTAHLSGEHDLVHMTRFCDNHHQVYSKSRLESQGLYKSLEKPGYNTPVLLFNQMMDIQHENLLNEN